MQWLEQYCFDQLKTADALHLRRSRKSIQQLDGRTLSFAGNTYLQFSSNDYLGLATQAPSMDQIQTSAGSGASPLVTGYTLIHEQLEHKLARYLGFEASLFFNSGFTANEGVIRTLVQSKDLVFADRLNHASLIDGVIHSKARSIRYKHSDIHDLRAKLINTPINENGRRWIITDSIFSMDGDVAPLREIIELAKEFNAALYIDDAHGFGVYGEGRGILKALNITSEDVDVLMIAFGKAMGASGACVLGKQVIIDYLVQKCRSYIYSTAPAPQTIALNLIQFEKLTKADASRQHLKSLSQKLFNALHDMSKQGFFQIQDEQHDVHGFHHPVHPVIVGSPELALSLGQFLLDHKIMVGIIRPPTVPQGTSRLRLSLSASHTLNDIDTLISLIGKFFQQ